MSVDSFIGGPNGELDWMTWDWDDELKNYVDELHKTVDTILLGRKMADGFIKHWTAVAANPDDEGHVFGKKMIDTPKIVFSKTLGSSEWENTQIASDLEGGVAKLKNSEGGDIIAYGGAGFDTSLIKAGLIDEYHLFINPTALGEGLTIFQGLKTRGNCFLQAPHHTNAGSSFSDTNQSVQSRRRKHKRRELATRFVASAGVEF